MNTKIHYTEWSKTHLLLLRPLGRFEIGQIEKFAGMGSTFYRLLLEASKAFVPVSRVKTVEGMVELDRTVTMHLELHKDPAMPNRYRSLTQELYIIEGSIEKHGLARYSLDLRPELAASVNAHAGNETCLDLAKAWLEECRREHKDCGTGAPTRLPSRLLEISQEDSSLVYLREVRGQMGSYAALSYCWGSSASRLKILCNALKVLQRRRNASAQAEAEDETQGMKCDIQDDFDIDIDTEKFYNTDIDEFKRLFNLQKTPETVFDAIKMASSTTASAQLDIVATKSNIDELKRGIDIQRLPRTVVDAIKVASHLSIRYIWVDRLCIIQDDPGDWARESRDMWAVFANALLTISADRSPDS
ncbi:hypothetical protein CEP54_011653 [Fusarium duplospermum]|uniref:Heterokaryon incompatibility domain-containing protein n=1 Tax=Fusarium duplospermum TaxID=1325734 RepID=A0A428PD66_9HYPO|nr:hypothetical protein CEP54_011653 [Fusarium duplospermum]